MPHAGFGLGFERTLAYVTGLAKHARRHPLPNDARECEVLMHTTLAIAVSFVDGERSTLSNLRPPENR